MAYLFNNQPYENQASVISAASAGLETIVSWADVEPQTQVLTVIELDHNPETQRTVWAGGVLDADAMTYTLAVIGRVHYARIGDRATVQEISEYPDELRNWQPVPDSMLSHIKPGVGCAWQYKDGAFSPIVWADFVSQCKQGVMGFADDVRKSLTAKYTDRQLTGFPFKAESARRMVNGTGDADDSARWDGEALSRNRGETGLQVATAALGKAGFFGEANHIIDGVQTACIDELVAFATTDSPSADAAAVIAMLDQRKLDAGARLAALKEKYAA